MVESRRRGDVGGLSRDKDENGKSPAKRCCVGLLEKFRPESKS